jgi:AcrR family transcriptional regulator
MSAIRARGSRPISVPSGRGGSQVSEVQRSRMLRSTVAVVSELGYGQMTVERITGGAGISRRTFYEVFTDREDCFLAAFDEGVARASERARAAYEGERGWCGQVRAALAVLLGLLDEQPGVGTLLVVDALKAGPRVQERRAEVLKRLARVLQRDGSRARSGRSLPPLTGEGVVGAVLGVVHARLLAGRAGRMSDLLGPLTGMVVLPYLGAAAARRELERPVPKPRRVRGMRGGATASYSDGDPLAGLPMRLTARTLLALQVIGEYPGASNREVAELAEISDQGQISKLLARLARLGLVENVGDGQPTGEPNAWRLTSRGEEVRRVQRVATQARSIPTHLQANGTRDSR